VPSQATQFLEIGDRLLHLARVDDRVGIGARPQVIASELGEGSFDGLDDGALDE